MQKAGSVTRISFESIGNRYIMKYEDLKILNLGRKTSLIRFIRKSSSKKMGLFNKVFSKFIQNNFIE